MSNYNIHVSSDLLTEINEKVKNNVIPMDKDKDVLSYKLNRQLDEEDHVYIFTEILQKMEKKIYTITENGTLFDLNDLDNATFWNVYYYTQIFIDNHERKKDIAKASKEDEERKNEQIQQFDNDLKRIKESAGEFVDKSNMTEYEKLRTDALSYSKRPEVVINSGEKRMEKTVYSDNYQFKWKQLSKTDEIAKKVTRISFRCDNKDNDPVPNEAKAAEIEEDEDEEADEEADEDEDEDEGEEEDMMVNDNESGMSEKQRVKILLKPKIN
jgi:hypothetical protein